MTFVGRARLVPLVALVFVGLCISGGVARAKAISSSAVGARVATAPGKPLVVPRCVITGVKVETATGKVAATGRCLVRKKYRVPIKWTYVYTAYDHAGYACGTPRAGKAKSFRLKPPGSHRLTVRFTLSAKPRRGLKRVKAVTKSRTFALGGQMAQCGTLGNVPLPPKQELCPWTEPEYASYCGAPMPNSECAWSSVPAMDGGVVSAGRLACETGNCWLEPLPRLRSFDWLGYTVETAWLRCGEHLIFNLHTWRVGMTGPAGQTCGPVRPPYVNFVSFKVPPTWGGELRVMWRIQGSRGQEVVTASFRLPGTEDGCPKLLGSDTSRLE